jgi:hypothetical protein
MDSGVFGQRVKVQGMALMGVFDVKSYSGGPQELQLHFQSSFTWITAAASSLNV